MLLHSEDLDLIKDQVHHLNEKEIIVNTLQEKGFEKNQYINYEIAFIGLKEVNKLIEKRSKSCLRNTLLFSLLIMALAFTKQLTANDNTIIVFIITAIVIPTLTYIYFSKKIELVMTRYIKHRK